MFHGRSIMPVSGRDKGAGTNVGMDSDPQAKPGAMRFGGIDEGIAAWAQ